MANRNENGNNTLFFIVGGLIVLAVIFGLFLWTPRDETNPADIAPAAGDERYIDGTMDNPDADQSAVTPETESETTTTPDQ